MKAFKGGGVIRRGGKGGGKAISAAPKGGFKGGNVRPTSLKNKGHVKA